MPNIQSTQQIGALIRQERKEQGLTQDQLAGLCATGRRFIIDIEAGKPTSQVGKVLLILKTLGIEVQLTKRGQ